jgi:hypothetical protein
LSPFSSPVGGVVGQEESIFMSLSERARFCYHKEAHQNRLLFSLFCLKMKAHSIFKILWYKNKHPRLWRVPKTLVQLIAIHHHQNPSRSSKSDYASRKCKISSESNLKLRKISQCFLTKLQKEGQVMIGHLVKS